MKLLLLKAKEKLQKVTNLKPNNDLYLFNDNESRPKNAKVFLLH